MGLQTKIFTVDIKVQYYRNSKIESVIRHIIRFTLAFVEGRQETLIKYTYQLQNALAVRKFETWKNVCIGNSYQHCFLNMCYIWCTSVQLSSVTQLYLTLRSHGLQHTRPLRAHHQLPEFTQTHVHWVGDAIQPSHPLLIPSPPAFDLSQHQGLFKWVSSSHQVAKVLEFQLQHQSFQWIFRADFL